MNPEIFSTTAIIYGRNYDKLEKEFLEQLQSPFLVITGSNDDWAVNAALRHNELIN